MTIITGGVGTGKSTKALEIFADCKNPLFLITDKDKRVIDTLKTSKSEWNYIKNPTLMDIQYRILEKGGIITNDIDYVFIDSLNMVSPNKSYLEKVEYLLDVEKTYNVKIYATLTTLSKITSVIKEIERVDGLDFLNVNNRSKIKLIL